jgi:hypothetical protein
MLGFRSSGKLLMLAFAEMANESKHRQFPFAKGAERSAGY